MNAEEIRQMEAGRELDALVATKVMGWRYSPFGNWPTQLTPPQHTETGYPVKTCPAYSTDIAAAWEVEQQLWDDAGLALTLERLGNYQQWEWFASFHDSGDGTEAVSGYHSAPLAICRAALLAVMGVE